MNAGEYLALTDEQQIAYRKTCRIEAMAARIYVSSRSMSAPDAFNRADYFETYRSDWLGRRDPR